MHKPVPETSRPCSYFGSKDFGSKESCLGVVLIAMPVRFTQQYCIGCQKKHRGQFYRSGLDPDEVFGYCKTAYHELEYQHRKEPGDLWHPSWRVLKAALTEIDITGHPIFALRWRADLQALASQDALVQDRAHEWSSLTNRVYFALFAFSMYWQWPMNALWEAVKNTQPADMTSKTWKDVAETIDKKLGDTRVHDGMLTRGVGGGVAMAHNPSSRDGSMEDLHRYIADAPAVMRVAGEVAAVLTPWPATIEIGTLLDAMANAKARVLSGERDYRCIRVARAIIFVLRLRPADSKGDWEIYRSMSRSIAAKMKRRGIWSFDSARRMRDAIRCHSGHTKYSFGDLTCLVCLMKE